MSSKAVFNEDFEYLKPEVASSIANFKTTGELIYGGSRNSIKVVDTTQALKLNIKAFKVPNFINQVVYSLFRKGKAERSFEYANYLQSLKIGTPTPIAYVINKSGFLYKKSYYVSEHLDYDVTFREVADDVNFPNRYEILKQFAQFTFVLHENGIEFLDHSPGNTLIVIGDNNQYSFYLVDLNRMKFHKELPYEIRIKNFSRLTNKKDVVSVISGEYAKLIGEDYHKVSTDLWEETQRFQYKFHRKKALKRKFKFWKRN